MSQRPGTLKKNLAWGQTPFDDMSREELLFEVRRMFSALQSCRCALALSRDERSPFWGPGGTGGDALHKADIALEDLDDGGEYAESIYRMYYRYAVDLLFEPKLGFGWWVCDACGDMWGDPIDVGGKPQKTCGNEHCTGFGGPLRRLDWNDMKPEADDGPTAETNP